MKKPTMTRIDANDPSRRDFLGGAAGLILALAIAPDPRSFIGEALADTSASLNVWVMIATDGTISIVSPAAEMGQGTFTTLPAVFAEELDADWARVVPVYPPEWNEKKYGNPGFTGGFLTSASWATRGYFTPMRIAGAQARRVLIDAVAGEWGVPAAELSTEPSVVVHAKSGRRISYGEIAAFAKAPAELPKIEQKDLKPAARFRLIGKDVPRVELPLKVTGAAKYSMDVQVPGMLYAAVLQCPYPWGSPQTVDDARARRVEGIIDVVKLPEGVGVIGTSVEATQAAKAVLKITWSGDAEGAHYDSERALDDFAAIGRDKSREGVTYASIGDVKTAMSRAAKVYRGEYRTRYVYHAQMEPLNATAAVSADGKSVEIWVGTQGPTALHNEVTALLGIDRKNISFHQHFLGGGYGRRGAQEVVLDAVRLSKAAGKPVKLIWTREDDIGGGKFRPMTAHFIEAGVDAAGKIIAWHHRVIAESPLAYGARASGTTPPRLDQVVMKGSPLPHYPIANKLAEHVVESRGARTAPLRGVGVGHNAFAIESFLDEIAKDQGKDPLAFRLSLSEGQPRAQALLRIVAEMSDWTRKRDGRALGIALAEKDDSLNAGVAEVSVDRATGKIKVHNFWAAIDAGLAVQPRNLAAQIEGGIIYGLGSVLREKITIRDGRVVESNFNDYEVTRMSDVPNVQVRVVSTDNPPTGAGEDGVPLVACAIGNAVASLTSVRLHELPFAPERVRGALGA
jgi:isoquinoline 1-oxidoreductase subunit beta